MDFTQENQNSIGTRLADQITAMLAYWDQNLICRFANSAYIDWFGKTKEEMIDKITIKDLLGPLYEMNLPYIEGALKGEKQTFEREIPRPNGGIRHSLANYYPDIVEGKVLGFFVHVADVNDLKCLKLELTKSNAVIIEQNKRLLNFSNVVSHNLKSYSGNLAFVLDLLNGAESENDRDEMFSMLKKISKQFSLAVNHLNEMVKAQNQAELKSESINLFDYVEKSKEILQIQILSSKAKVINNVSREVQLIANPVYIESILLNLLTNSIKYRRQDKYPVITIKSEFEKGRLAVSITDNGRGIDLERHGNDLFGMYKTFHGNADAQGIGLFITKYQIQTMGGEINVVSKVNEGTTFTVHFDASSLTEQTS